MIAFILPTFTDAAYNKSFYLFFKKYAPVSNNTSIYTDLDLLTGKIPSRNYTQNFKAFPMLKMTNDIKASLDERADIFVLTDEDAQFGNIFNVIGNNIYDVLILVH